MNHHSPQTMFTLRRGLSSRFLHHSRLSSTFSKLESSLKARQIPILYDYLTPQPSHLLTTTLADFLTFLSADLSPRLPSTSSPSPLPISHHLVYFPTPARPSSLLPDGTDTLHSPGEPFTNRLWAGGHIRFLKPDEPLLDGSRVAIVENIRSVRESGQPGAEKIFVGIERCVAHVKEGEDDLKVRQRVWPEDEAKQDEAIIIERRDLCFLRPETTSKDEPSSSETTKDTPPHRSLPSPSNPEFTHSLIPTPHLLTRYSALTYNAHAIHLDPLYTMIEYNQPGLLVHGPLLLTLMLSCLGHELEKHERIIKEISYRCLSPVFVGEKIRVCGKKLTAKSGKKEHAKGDQKDGLAEDDGWEVWIEKGGAEQQGGEQATTPALAVRGTVKTEYVGTIANAIEDAAGFGNAGNGRKKADEHQTEPDKMGDVPHDVDADVADEWL